MQRPRLTVRCTGVGPEIGAGQVDSAAIRAGRGAGAGGAAPDDFAVEVEHVLRLTLVQLAGRSAPLLRPFDPVEREQRAP